MKKNILKKVLPYKLRNATMALAATVAGMATTSCEKEDDILPDEPKKEQIIPTKEEVLWLYSADNIGALVGQSNDNAKIWNLQYMDSLMTQPDVKSVTLKLGGRWDHANERMHLFRELLEPVANIAPEKFKGEGDFVRHGLPRGTMSGTEQAVSDSLWFVKQGWTFNGR